MISRLGELTALPAYLHISSYATLAMLSLINRSNACNCRTYPRRGLPTCVATGQQLEFDHQHRILLPQCTLVISFMKTGRLPSQTKVLASIIKQTVLTSNPIFRKYL